MFAYPLDEEIRLELIEPRHADALFALVEGNREHLQRWHPWVAGTRTVADTKAYIESERRTYLDTGAFHSVIRYQGALSGIVGFNGIDRNNARAALGYWLAEDKQGRGIITRCCAAFITHGFGVLGLHRIEIHCGEANTRSRAVAERLGFTCEGVLRERERLDASYTNHAVYGLLAEEWDQSVRCAQSISGGALSQASTCGGNSRGCGS